MTSLEERMEQEVAALGDLPRDELVARWIRAYGCLPPKGVKRCLLERAAAWHLQARHLGGLSPAARKAIRDAARAHRGGGGRPRKPDSVTDVVSTDRDVTRASQAAGHAVHIVPAPALRPGSRLVREWNGRTHVVDVRDSGFVFDGKTYRSLSAIAKRITGAHWSGPRFFGL